MTTLKFKAGDDVPDYILKPLPDCDPIKSIVFVTDAEALYYQGVWHVWPTVFGEGTASVSVRPSDKSACVRLTGGPTMWHAFPVSAEQREWMQSESNAAMPVNYGDKAADTCAVSLPDNAVWYRGRE